MVITNACQPSGKYPCARFEFICNLYRDFPWNEPAIKVLRVIRALRVLRSIRTLPLFRELYIMTFGLCPTLAVIETTVDSRTHVLEHLFIENILHSLGLCSSTSA